MQSRFPRLLLRLSLLATFGLSPVQLTYPLRGSSPAILGLAQARRSPVQAWNGLAELPGSTHSAIVGSQPALFKPHQVDANRGICFGFHTVDTKSAREGQVGLCVADASHKGFDLSWTMKLRPAEGPR